MRPSTARSFTLSQLWPDFKIATEKTTPTCSNSAMVPEKFKAESISLEEKCPHSLKESTLKPISTATTLLSSSQDSLMERRSSTFKWSGQLSITTLLQSTFQMLSWVHWSEEKIDISKQSSKLKVWSFIVALKFVLCFLTYIFTKYLDWNLKGNASQKIK